MCDGSEQGWAIAGLIVAGAMLASSFMGQIEAGAARPVREPPAQSRAQPAVMVSADPLAIVLRSGETRVTVEFGL